MIFSHQLCAYLYESGVEHVGQVPGAEAGQQGHHLLPLLGVIKQPPLSPGSQVRVKCGELDHCKKVSPCGHSACTLPQPSPDVTRRCHPHTQTSLLKIIVS